MSKKYVIITICTILIFKGKEILKSVYPIIFLCIRSDSVKNIKTRISSAKKEKTPNKWGLITVIKSTHYDVFQLL